MKTSQWSWRGLAIIGCLCLLGLDSGTDARRTRLPRAMDAEEGAKIKRLNAQLDEILAVQADILKRCDELMEELQVVKVRASR